MRRGSPENHATSDSNLLPFVIAFLATFTGTGIGCAVFMALHEIQTIARLIDAAQ